MFAPRMQVRDHRAARREQLRQRGAATEDVGLDLAHRNAQPRGRIGLLPLITESAGALLKAASFTALPSRVTGLTWGAEDLAADVGALGNKASDGEFELTYAMARSFCLLAAASAGVPAFDTVDTEIRDAVAGERRARSSRRLNGLVT